MIHSLFPFSFTPYRNSFFVLLPWMAKVSHFQVQLLANFLTRDWVLILLVMNKLKENFYTFETGFVSLDCGGKENFTDELGLVWTSDANLIYGETAIVSVTNETRKQYTTLRHFPADSRTFLVICHHFLCPHSSDHFLHSHYREWRLRFPSSLSFSFFFFLRTLPLLRCQVTLLPLLFFSCI